jgi:cbb3-type cytochrome oxidase subunit 1
MRKVGINIKLSAYGILAIATIAMIFYFLANQIGRPDIGFPLLTLTYFIVIAFIIYMFVKLFRR